MKRRAILPSVFLGLLVGNALADDKPPPTDSDRLQGTWVLTSIKVGGDTPAHKETSERLTLTLDGNKSVLRVRGTRDKEGPFKVTGKPPKKHMDLVAFDPSTDPGKDRPTYRAIYSLRGDRLLVGVDANDPWNFRPRSFSDLGTRTYGFERKAAPKDDER